MPQTQAARERTNRVIRVDANKVNEILKQRGWSQVLLAEKMGMQSPTLNQNINYNGMEPMAYKLMCMILGQEEEALKYKEPKPITTISGSSEVGNILSNNAILETLNEIKQQQKEIREDMVLMAKMIAEIQKTTNEAKAQTNLNADELVNICRKTVEINSTVNKISGWMNAKYRASKVV